MNEQALATQKPPFLQAISSQVILADGSLDTLIYEKGVYINQNFENLNLARPHLIKNIHQEYLRAGAELIGTNTFNGNAFKLLKHGLQDKVREINLAGVRLAREAAQGAAWIGGTIGPPGQDLEGDFNAASGDKLREVYRAQASYLLEGEVDLFLVENFSHLPTLEIVISELKNLSPDTPIVALVIIEQDGKTQFGDDGKSIATILNSTQADVIGLCDGPGPAKLNEVLVEMASHTSKPLGLLPGTGYPVRHEDRLLSLASPEYFMELLRQGIHKGARLIGGSSGCIPDYIRAVCSSVKMLQPVSEKAQNSHIEDASSPKEKTPIVCNQADTPSRFAERMRAGKFVVSVEIDPPVGTDAERSLDAAEECARSGLVDCINIADGPRATARMGPMDMALLLRRRTTAVEPIVHFCCRDRNILGMQADLIGANALDVFNILMITGDPPKLGDYPFASAVYDVDAIGALKIANNLNREMDLAGNPLKGGATKLFIGCGANPGAIDLDHEISRLEQKVEAGAEYILTQPVYDFELFQVFYEKTRHIQAPILLGILPLASYRNAEFLTKEVPGMHVPEEIREKLKKCEDKESARQTGIEIAQKSLSDALPFIQGTYIMPPFNRVDSALEVLEAAKSRIEVKKTDDVTAISN